MSRDEDIAVVEKLAESAGVWLKAIEEALPALARLRAADHPGAGWVDEHASATVERGGNSTLRDLHDSLMAFCAAKGNQAAADFEFYARYFGDSVDKAAMGMVDSEHGSLEMLERAAAMRRYAESIA